jgi:hypothetical protein
LAVRQGVATGKCGTVETSKARLLVLLTKDTQFVTEHDDFEILGGLALVIWY